MALVVFLHKYVIHGINLSCISRADMINPTLKFTNTIPNMVPNVQPELSHLIPTNPIQSNSNTYSPSHISLTPSPRTPATCKSDPIPPPLPVNCTLSGLFLLSGGGIGGGGVCEV